MCKGAQRAQKANNYQAQNKEFTSVREVIWVFIQHCSDDRLQPTKLKHTHTITHVESYFLVTVIGFLL